MVICFSILAWKIPLTEDPGCLLSMGLQKLGPDWVTEHMHTTWCAGTYWCTMGEYGCKTLVLFPRTSLGKPGWFWTCGLLRFIYCSFVIQTVPFSI